MVNIQGEWMITQRQARTKLLTDRRRCEQTRGPGSTSGFEGGKTASSSLGSNLGRGDAALAQTFLTQSRRGRWGCGDTEGIAGSVFFRLRQARSVRLASKNQGVSLRALPACAWHLSASRTRQAGADRRLCVSNCNTWVQWISPAGLMLSPAQNESGQGPARKSGASLARNDVVW